MMNNGNVLDLQKILGHSDIKMTMRYAHYSSEQLQAAMKGFELGHSSVIAQNSPTQFAEEFSSEGEVVALNGQGIDKKKAQGARPGL